MQIDSVSVTGLHGFINAEIAFQGDVAIIVGVNGSGKTSILNLSANLARLNVIELFDTVFRSLTITGKLKRKTVEIIGTREGETLSISALWGGSRVGKLSLALPDLPRTNAPRGYMRERYLRRMYDDMHRNPVAAFLREHIHLTLVKLDRSLFAEESDGSVAIDSPAWQQRSDSPVKDPISKVEEVTRTKYQKYHVDIARVNDALMRKIVALLFRVPRHAFQSTPSRAPIDRAAITTLKNKVLGSQLLSPESASLVREYFDFAEQALDVTPNPAEDATAMAVRLFFREFEFRRLAGLLEAFKDSDESLTAAYSDLDRFLQTINSFLSESGKEVFFSPTDFCLRFRLKGFTGMERPIAQLSSGEKQIVTMLTYLAFMAGEESIFVVDEPELSLHLAWQRQLVDALISLRPKGGQLILATHSPEIVGKHRSAVVGLSPRYDSH